MNAIDLKAVKLAQELIISTVIYGEVITEKRINEALHSICALFKLTCDMDICLIELKRRNNA